MHDNGKEKRKDIKSGGQKKMHPDLLPNNCVTTC